MKKLFIKLILFLIFILIIVLNTKTNKQLYNYVYKDNYIYLDNLKIEEPKIEAKETFQGQMTAYSPYCTGCTGITASGYNVKNTIYYNDKEYGKIRIIAMDKKYKFGTIVKLTNIDNYNDTYAIVLDRGSAIGNNKKSQIDLLFETEKECINFGRKYNVTIEVLRYGY